MERVVAQTAGPTSFRVDDSVDLALTVSDLSFAAPDAQGCRTGTVTVTVANNGSTAVTDVAVLLKVNGLCAPGEGFANCPGEPGHPARGPRGGAQWAEVRVPFSVEYRPPAAPARSSGSGSRSADRRVCTPSA